MFTQARKIQVSFVHREPKQLLLVFVLFMQ